MMSSGILCHTQIGPNDSESQISNSDPSKLPRSANNSNQITSTDPNYGEDTDYIGVILAMKARF
jgi:hypothetical protein